MMAEDGREESVATDDDSDLTAADGSNSLNNTPPDRGRKERGRRRSFGRRR